MTVNSHSVLLYLEISIAELVNSVIMWLMAMLPTWIFLPDDYVSDEEIPRKSQDNIVNSNGQLLLEFLKHSDLRIANGRVCEDKQIGAYTYV